MRQIFLMTLLVFVAAGCGKKKAPEPSVDIKVSDDATTDTTAADRTKLLSNIKSSNQKIKKDAVEELMDWVDSDPESVTAMLELLKDKTTAGSGKILVTQINSTREAAARVLLGGGPKGEAALKTKALPILREGLNDSQPAVREHTAYTIGLLGPMGKPLSNDVLKLCSDSDANVRGAAFDALKMIGIADLPAFVALLKNSNPEIAGLAAEQVAALQQVPPEVIEPLIAALASEVPVVRFGAAAAIATAGPAGGPAAKAVVEAIKKTYPAEVKGFYQPGSEMVYWRALSKIGPDAAAPTIELLAHANPFVRKFAAQSLGEIGPPAKAASEKLKELLKDMLVPVKIEAACALCSIGADSESALAFMKQGIDAMDAVAQAVIEAIPRMGESGKQLLPLALEKLKSSNPFARYAAIGLVGALPPAEAGKYAAQIGQFTTDKIDDIRGQTAFVLARLGAVGSPAAEAIGKAVQEEKVERIRALLIDALLAMGPGAKPALPALLTVARDKERSQQAYRIRGIAAIVEADPAAKEVQAELLSCAGDGEAPVRAAAAQALGRLEPLSPEAIAKLVALAKSDRDYKPRLAAVRALALAGKRSASARGELEAIAKGPQPGLALWATVGLASFDGDVAKSAPAIRSALSDRRYPARAAGTEALLLIGPAPTDLPALIKLLKDLDPNSREGAARCIGKLGQKGAEAVPQLAALLADQDSDVRIAAVGALGEMGKVSIPTVERLRALSLSDPLAAEAARRSLAKLGEK